MKLAQFVILAMVILFASTPSNAALHSKDDPVFGPGSVTYDDTTGLEWLDLTFSTNISYNDMVTQFGPGGAFEGWRHATLLEANERSIHAGITINIGSTPQNYAPAAALLELIGVTAVSGIGTQALGFVSDPGSPGFRKVFSVATHDGPTGSSALAFHQADNLGDPALAHYLVRDTSTSNVTFRFEGRLQSGQLLEISYTFNPALAQPNNVGAGFIYTGMMQSATIKVNGVTLPASLRTNASIIYIQNNLQADQNYDRYQAILEFSPTVNAAGLSFDRIFIYGEDPTSAPSFSTVLNSEALLLDPGTLFGFPILQAIFQGGSGGPGNPSPTIAPVTSSFDEDEGGDISSSLPLRTFDLKVGVNKISGAEFLDSSGGFDVDSMSFKVPAGTQLESIEYAYDFSFEPGAQSLQRALTLWRGTFAQNLANRTVVFRFSQNPSIEDVSPVDVFSAVMPLTPDTYTWGGGGGIGHEGGWSGIRRWNYTLRLVVRSTAPPDTTPPTIEPTVIGESQGSNGWYRGDVELYWKVTDGESGVMALSGCRAARFTTDTVAPFTCTASSGGGTSSQSVTINRDGTRPVVNAMFGPLPNIHGWNNSNVTVTFEGTDPMPGSGIANCTPTRVLSQEGDNLSAFGFCADVAGNSSRSGGEVTGIRIDKTAPTAGVVMPQSGASYASGTAFNADYSCADERSGILNCNGPVPSGEPFDTTTVGPQTFTVTAIDFAGNVTTAVSSYTVTDPALPVYVLSQGALAFVDQAISVSSAVQFITLTNNGLVAVPITSITRTGANANQFSQTNDCAASVPAGASCTISVVFRPTSAGAKIASLNVNGAGGAGTKSVALSGTGVVAAYDLAPGALAFGVQGRNIPSGAQPVTLSNTGAVDLPITSVTRTGTNANQFSQTNDCGALVAVGASCTINVVFLPTSVGDKTATLNVNAGGGGGTHSVNLSGTGIVPTYALAPNPLAFADQTVTVPSATQAITLSNTGAIALPLTSVALTGGNANQFSQTNNCGASIEAGASCTISVVFLPTSVGAKTTSVTLTAGGGAGNQTVSVTGTAVPPTYSLSTAALVFGNQARSVPSGAQAITLANTGPAALTITTITRTGTNANQFSQTNDCGTSVAVGASCTISVVFLPTSTGDKLATLSVNTSLGAGTKSVNLSGTGIVPVYALAPSPLNFASQLRNTSSAPQAVTLTNTGELELPITGITLNGANANQFSQTNDCGAAVAVGASCTINVVFRPTSAGAKSANVRVAFGGGAVTPALVPLTGTGL